MKNESNVRKKTLPVDYTQALKIAENELKKVGIGGNYYGLEPYSATNALEKSKTAIWTWSFLSRRRRMSSVVRNS